MMLRHFFPIIVGFVLLAAIVGFSIRVASGHTNARLEFSQVKRSHVTADAHEKLTALKHNVLITYYVSPRSQLPSDMKSMRDDVADILAAMKAASGGRLDFAIVNPESTPEVAEYASRQQVAPFRRRTVKHDSFDEQTLWSALQIAYGPLDSVVINGVTPGHIARLQAMIVEQLRQMEQPRRPVFGVAAPEGFDGLVGLLTMQGEVRRIEINGISDIPDGLDVLYWLSPQSVTPEMLRQLRQFLASGGSVVLAGHQQSVNVQIQDGEPAFEFVETGFDAAAMLSAFGLRIEPATVLDESSQQLSFAPQSSEAAAPDKQVSMKFMVRCVGPNQDFRSMRDQPNGNLLFELPMAMTVDADLMNDLGFTATVLATTSDRTSVGPMIWGRRRIESLGTLPIEPAAKLPLVLWLRPNEPWRGSVVVCASPTPFEDRWLAADNYAHRRLVDSLNRTLASSDRLVLRGAGFSSRESLPELTSGSRIFWRIVCIGLAPGLLSALGFRRWLKAWRAESSQSSRQSRELAGIFWRAATAFAMVLVVAGIAAGFGFREDLTRNDANSISPECKAIAEQATGEQSVQATLYVSGPGTLAPSMTPLIRRLHQVIADLRRAGAAMTLNTVHPEELSSSERDALHAQGIQQMQAASILEEVTTIRTMYCTLVLRRGERVQRLAFLNQADFENMEFRIAFALWRLQAGRQPHIALATDRPRLSPAEALQDFQRQSLHAPSGTDVYSLARQSLERLDFRVTSVNPQNPFIPDDVDLIIWMQPRRSVYPMLQAAIERLAAGVPVMIAAQHFNIQARQYRADSFRMVYWPQPQEPDLNRVYLPQIGVELVREIVLDELRANVPLETQVNLAEGLREYVPQESALPFFIRLPAGSSDSFAAHPITQGLGEQVLPFASAMRLDTDLLARLGLSATPLMFTSDRSWTFRWSGGWLPDDVLDGTAATQADRVAREGRLPVAVLLEGVFPVPKFSLTTRTADDVTPVEFATTSSGEPSRLLLIGCSQMFKDERMRDSQFRSDHLLANAAAWLALPRELAEVAAHRHIAPGLAIIEPQRRMAWRAAVLGAGPAMLVLLGFGWAVARRGRIHQLAFVAEGES